MLKNLMFSLKNPIYRQLRTCSTQKALNMDVFTKNHIGITIIPPEHVAVVERIGKFHKILPSGLHTLIPIIDKISHIFPMQTIYLQTPSQEILTKSAIKLSLQSRITVVMTNAHKAAYVAKTPFTLAILDAQTTIQNIISNFSLEEFLLNQSSIALQAQLATNEKTENYGIKTLKQEIVKVDLPSAIQDSIIADIVAKQKEAERVLQAETDANIRKIQTESEATALALMGDAIRKNPEAAACFLTNQTMNILGPALSRSLHEIQKSSESKNPKQ
jgi:regulator of protease activity HflC (stomatin/prohibitin superfamily)